MKKEKKSPVWKLIKIFLAFLFFYAFIILLPLIHLVPRFITGTHLILFTNEFEARPCGGFVTAFGTFSLLPFHYELKNVYHFESDSFGKAMPPLDKVASELKFWDLGTDTDVNLCVQKFENAYQTMTDQEIKNVVLFNLGTIEKLFGVLGEIKTEDLTLNEKTFFSVLSQKAANVDRHDETSLENRKKTASVAGKQMIKKLLFHPFLLPKITYFLAQRIKTGEIFVEGFSPEIKPKETDFSVIEWNLGGGKSSRFLRKKIKISLREEMPQKWEMKFDFSVDHLGGVDEPISQTWNGVFELRFPRVLNIEPVFLTQTLAPGESFEKTFTKAYEGNLSTKNFSFFLPRGQSVFAEISVSLFPEKTFEYSTLETHENVGYFWGKISGGRKDFLWTETKDERPPFITLHEIINANDELNEKFPSSNLLAEIHFNEKVRIMDNLSLQLVDRDFANKQVTENPVMQNYVLLPDQKTLLLGFSQTRFQKDERFYLTIEGVADFFGNEIVPQARTLISR